MKLVNYTLCFEKDYPVGKKMTLLLFRQNIYCPFKGTEGLKLAFPQSYLEGLLEQIVDLIP